ncbi:MAG TPA: CRISPR-associated endonuclease Cas2 [Candidatus Wallbacteria bacterium]|nr:CRISPR-associated endonuclease Cas2 [Candidatus Wallbacteria bacterium]
MFYIVCYDTPSNRRRRKMVNVLKNHIRHVQKSVFEGHLTKDKFDKMSELLEKNIDPAEDSVRIYELPKDMVLKIKAFGQPPVMDDPSFYMV